MVRRKVIVLLAVTALAITIASGTAVAEGSELDQQQTEYNGTEVIDSDGDFQYFTAGKSGKLEKVSLYVGCCDPAGSPSNGDLLVRVANGVGVWIRGSTFQTDGSLKWVDVEIPDGFEPLVEAGQQYRIALEAKRDSQTGAARIDPPYYLWGYYDNNDKDSYPGGYREDCDVSQSGGGTTTCSDPGGDGAFKTYVTPDPANTSITSGPDEGSTLTTKSASFYFSADLDDATFECKLDSRDWESCTSPWTYTDLPDGGHTFQVRATSVSGETEYTPAVRHWRVDTTAPNTTLSATGMLPPLSFTATNRTLASLPFASNESNSTFQCKLEPLESEWSDCTSPATYGDASNPPPLAEGEYFFQVYAVDQWGNADKTPASRRLIVDRTPPTTTAKATTSDSSGVTSDYTSGTPTNKDVTVTLEAKDTGGAGVREIRYRINGDTEQVAAGDSKEILVDTEGPTTISYYAIDTSFPIGATREAAQTFTVELDKTAPSVDDGSLKPANNETGVSRSIKEVKASFSEPVDPNTVSTSTETVQLFSGNSKNPLKAQVSLSTDGKTVTLIPPQKLDAKTKYTVKISDGVKDLAGNALAPYTWSFTTGSQ